jgi:hypothetical protein
VILAFVIVFARRLRPALPFMTKRDRHLCAQ